jgi:hypothetical protein
MKRKAFSCPSLWVFDLCKRYNNQSFVETAIYRVFGLGFIASLVWDLSRLWFGIYRVFGLGFIASSFA